MDIKLELPDYVSGADETPTIQIKEEVVEPVETDDSPLTCPTVTEDEQFNVLDVLKEIRKKTTKKKKANNVKTLINLNLKEEMLDDEPSSSEIFSTLAENDSHENSISSEDPNPKEDDQFRVVRGVGHIKHAKGKSGICLVCEKRDELVNMRILVNSKPSMQVAKILGIEEKVFKCFELDQKDRTIICLEHVAELLNDNRGCVKRRLCAICDLEAPITEMTFVYRKSVGKVYDDEYGLGTKLHDMVPEHRPSRANCPAICRKHIVIRKSKCKGSMRYRCLHCDVQRDFKELTRLKCKKTASDYQEYYGIGTKITDKLEVTKLVWLCVEHMEDFKRNMVLEPKTRHLDVRKWKIRADHSDTRCDYCERPPRETNQRLKQIQTFRKAIHVGYFLNVGDKFKQMMCQAERKWVRICESHFPPDDWEIPEGIDVSHYFARKRRYDLMIEQMPELPTCVRCKKETKSCDLLKITKANARFVDQILQQNGEILNNYKEKDFWICPRHMDVRFSKSKVVVDCSVCGVIQEYKHMWRCSMLDVSRQLETVLQLEIGTLSTLLVENTYLALPFFICRSHTIDDGSDMSLRRIRTTLRKNKRNLLYKFREWKHSKQLEDVVEESLIGPEMEEESDDEEEILPHLNPLPRNTSAVAPSNKAPKEPTSVNLSDVLKAYSKIMKKMMAEEQVDIEFLLPPSTELVNDVNGDVSVREESDKFDGETANDQGSSGAQKMQGRKVQIKMETKDLIPLLGESSSDVLGSTSKAAEETSKSSSQPFYKAPESSLNTDPEMSRSSPQSDTESSTFPVESLFRR